MRVLGGIILVLVTIPLACTNPFAPELTDSDPFGELLGDPTTIDGFYTRFQNAYIFRDTTLYGPLIHPEFVFTYRDFDRNVDVSWGRSLEIITTHRLFLESNDIQLQWNNVVTSFVNPDKTQAQIIRRFNLSVVLSQADVIRTDGSANFVLERPDSTQAWQLIRWRDESDI
jgi:hypothetical protein